MEAVFYLFNIERLCSQLIYLLIAPSKSSSK